MTTKLDPIISNRSRDLLYDRKGERLSCELEQFKEIKKLTNGTEVKLKIIPHFEEEYKWARLKNASKNGLIKLI